MKGDLQLLLLLDGRNEMRRKHVEKMFKEDNCNF
jgi:hypothetical protein